MWELSSELRRVRASDDDHFYSMLSTGTVHQFFSGKPSSYKKKRGATATAETRTYVCRNYIKSYQTKKKWKEEVCNLENIFLSRSHKIVIHLLCNIVVALYNYIYAMRILSKRDESLHKQLPSGEKWNRKSGEKGRRKRRKKVLYYWTVRGKKGDGSMCIYIITIPFLIIWPHRIIEKKKTSTTSEFMLNLNA